MRLASLIVLALLASFIGPAVMACMSPDTRLTAEEMQCCEQMKHDCDGMGMPANHSCCKPKVSVLRPYVLSSSAQIILRFTAVPGIQAPLSLGDAALRVTAEGRAFVSPSPPGSSSFSILRI